LGACLAIQVGPLLDLYGKQWDMIEKGKALIGKYYEQLSYLFFGGVATLLNLVVFDVFQVVWGTGFATGIGNVLDNVICILFAYWTNRNFVFKSKNHGADSWKEFGQFVACRLGTLVLDQFNIWLGVSIFGGFLAFAKGNPAMWARIVKVISQVIVIVANYVFSKLFIFKTKGESPKQGGNLQ
jgi:putative flippase GtrA